MDRELAERASKPLAAAAARRTRELPVLPTDGAIIVNGWPAAALVMYCGSLHVHHVHGSVSSLTLTAALAGPFEVTG